MTNKLKMSQFLGMIIYFQKTKLQRMLWEIDKKKNEHENISEELSKKHRGRLAGMLG